jgi:roadblock/LC7 domain-containing protein
MYAPVRRAVEASIQIKALEGSHRKGIFSPYGKVTAFITDIQEEIVLFDSESSGAVMNIRDDGSFEL